MNLDLNEDVKHWGIPDVQQWLAQVSFSSTPVFFLVFLFDQIQYHDGGSSCWLVIVDSICSGSSG
mgnify:CR=1 FL=1